jgi:alanyl-tRNA synthetase
MELRSIRDTLKVPNQKTILERLQELDKEKHALQANYDALLKDAMRAKIDDYLNEIVTVHDLSTLWIEETQLDKEIASDIVDRLKDRVDIVVLANKGEDSVSFLVSSSEKAIGNGYKAGDLAKALAVATGGNGGGRPNFAQSGGKDVSKLNEAFMLFCDKMNISK